jgi:small subunit ribosomal protein S21
MPHIKPCAVAFGPPCKMKQTPRKVVILMIRVDVRENDVEQALRRLKKVMNREGAFRELRQRRHYEKPFEIRIRKEREGLRRVRKAEWRRKMEL